MKRFLLVVGLIFFILQGYGLLHKVNKETPKKESPNQSTYFPN